MALLNKIFGKIEHVIFQPWLNPFATFYINFRLCNFKDAIKFPIFVYGKAYFDLLKGNVKFNCDVKCGIIKIGQVAAHFTSPKGSVYFFLEEKSTIQFNGNCLISIDTSFRLLNGSLLQIGKDVLIGDSVKIMSESKIEIGDNTRITFGTQIIDTNFHYIHDIENKIVHRKNSPIVIGANNWIGNHSSIMKGASTCDWCILASGSLLNKKIEEEFVVLAGRPAKIIDTNKKRIFDLKEEAILDKFFKDNNEINFLEKD